ncbi:cell division protein SepF [Bacillus thermotolerans]|uniref:Cell division protein SepF n=1 Tax=Bacillus thermotolerans TaxID=1221996 RepID=A0A0F5I9I9_BACTR|nr:cell division protein SepF [Bacillus thermotolerans]KKB39268.1 FtsZ-interacting protein [Bacillus thermotolerans]KKB42284.1 FtsZ-interacting protein [Bacillus thermotolerans]KKB43932.1 FtsZ-interacting protein [Bacillus thermotolerans]
MGIKSKFKSLFLLDDDDYQLMEEAEAPEMEQVPHSQTAKKNVVSLKSVQKSSSSKVILSEPRVFAEAQEIADHLKYKKAVIINLQRIQHDQAKRVIDFLSGTVYAVGGEIQQLGPKIFLCTPENVEVDGSITQFLAEDDIDNTRWP